MNMMKGPGFPDPLFEDIDELDEIAESADQAAEFDLIAYLLDEAPIGALRSADPILGDLTVMAREAVNRVGARLEELRNPNGGVPLGQA
jgi:hypothetical protein